MSYPSEPPEPVWLSRERIASVDFWRGVCLLMIFIDHIPGNPISYLTLRNWGFVDASEVFVFLAGFSATLVFDRYFRQGGIICGCLRVAKRTWELFRAHVLLVFALSLIIAVAGTFTDSKPIMERMNFSPFFVETEVAIVRVAKLQYMPNLTDVLPIYVAFIGLFPVLWCLTELSVYAALAASICLWAIANITGQSLPSYPEGAKWFFNPLAWQLMFVLGSILARRRQTAVVLLQSKMLLCLAAVIVLAGMVFAAPWTAIEGLADYRIVPLRFLAINDKANLSPVRIVHFLAVLVLATYALRPHSKFWKRRLPGVISTVGRHALPVYCVGVVLALMAQISIGIHGSGPLEMISLTTFGLCALVSLAFGLEGAASRLAVVKAPPLTMR